MGMSQGGLCQLCGRSRGKQNSMSSAVDTSQEDTHHKLRRSWQSCIPRPHPLALSPVTYILRDQIPIAQICMKGNTKSERLAV